MSTSAIAKDAVDLARRVIREYDGDYGMTVGLKEDAESLLKALASVEETLDASVSARPSADLLAGLKWAIRMMQGESGAGDSYWDQFPEYVAACKALKRWEGV